MKLFEHTLKDWINLIIQTYNKLISKGSNILNAEMALFHISLTMLLSVSRENKIAYKSLEVRREFFQNIIRPLFAKLAHLLYYPITNYFFQLSGGVGR